MKANFALSLSFDGIRLLHRAAGGWRRVGEVSLADDDLGASLKALHQSAERLEPDGVRTKLIIPDDQIRYLTIGTPGADDEARRAAARSALDGATPYKVDDLAFDISPDGERTHIAAVARDTLSEAEAFAVDHAFNPVSVVAIPQTAEFLGEPFFGATSHAATLIVGDDAVEPDGIAVVVLGDDLPTDIPAAVVEPLVEAADQDANPPRDLAPAGEFAEDPSPFVDAPVSTKVPAPTLSDAPATSGLQDNADTEQTLISDLPTPDTTVAEHVEEIADTAKALPETTVISALPQAVDAQAENPEPEPEISITVADEPDVSEPADPVSTKLEFASAADLTGPADTADTSPETEATGTADSTPTGNTDQEEVEPTVISERPLIENPAPSEQPVSVDIRESISTPDTPVEANERTIISELPPLEDVPAAAADTEAPSAAKAEDVTIISSLPEAPSEQEKPAAPVGFASRRGGNAGSAAPNLGGVSRTATTNSPEQASLSATRPDETSEPAENVTDIGDKAPSSLSLVGFLSRRKAQQPAKDETATAPERTREPPRSLPPHRVPKPTSERQGMTIFGARKQEPEMVIGGKPRFLGLILTAVLLVFLAGMAAWASVFLDEGLSRFFAPRELDTPMRAEELEPEPEPGAAAVQTASLLQDLPPPRVVTALAEPEPADSFDPQKAQEFYAVTGIWTIPPEVPDAPSMIDLDDLYITSIDRRSLSFDAVALAKPVPHETDSPLSGPANPPPAGSSFVLDARGLVVPAPGGTLSPDGITVFLGRPSSVPPVRPEFAAPLPSGETAASNNPELVAFRPKSRPADLVEQTERSNLGGLSRAELAEMRPRMRPASIKVEEEKDETPTAQAVASSTRPATRPSGFEKTVAAARQAPKPAAQPAETTRRVAAVAPRTVAPAIPSRTSVAKQATVKNAINLRKVNLMGVFGTPSNRRALVRLANGKYKKVKVGDRVDGGRVSAIGEGELRYQKGGRNIVLKMPRT